MNLTKCFVAGLCVTAMTASAGFLGATNDFEGGTLEGVWTGGVDSFDIVDASTGFTDANSPIVGVTDNKLLKLDTEGGVWTNTIEQSYAAASIYADMLVKFVPSEELPSVDGMVKLAIAVTNGYLVVTREDGNGGNEWIGTSVGVDTSQWYRVTVQLTYEDPVSKATIKINGNEVSVGGLTSFVITDNDGWATLKSIGFQGTGFIDEVTVRDDNPFGSVQFAGTGAVILNEAAYDSWLSTNSLTRGTVQLAQYNAFLWNVAPDGAVSPNLKVSSITVGGNVVLTIAADYTGLTSDVAINPAALNNGAQVNVLGKVSLSDASWANIGTALNFNPVVGASTNQFFKVDIAVP